MSADDYRFPHWAEISDHLRLGNGGVFPIDGSPHVDLVLTPGAQQIAIYVEGGANEPLASPLSEIRVTNEQWQGARTLRVVCAEPSLLRAFFDFICCIADEVQLNRRLALEALDLAARQYLRLFERVRLLSEEQEVGLIGELLILEMVARLSSWGFGLDAWHRATNAEHDFDLGNVDLEAKSTRTETRVHVINSLTQLEPTQGRRLFVASVQLTATGAGAGINLPSLVKHLADAAESEQAGLGAALRARVREVGYRDEHAPHYVSNLRLRDSIMLIHVDKSCPSLVPASLMQLAPHTAPRFRRVSYSVDLSGLGAQLTDERLGELIND